MGSNFCSFTAPLTLHRSVGSPVCVIPAPFPSLTTGLHPTCRRTMFSMISVHAAPTDTAGLRAYTFGEYTGEFNKVYVGEEAAERAKIFGANVEKIIAHNADPQWTYKLGVNKFADMTVMATLQLGRLRPSCELIPCVAFPSSVHGVQGLLPGLFQGPYARRRIARSDSGAKCLRWPKGNQRHV
jgi:hypothetical protein